MRAVIAVAVVLLAATAQAIVVNHENVSAMLQFSKWIVDQKKHYSTTAEYDHAFHNFQATLKRLAHYTARGRKGYGLTKFADLSADEFRAQYLLPKGMVAQNAARMKEHFAVAPTPQAKRHAPPPAKWNWVTKGATTPVKDQQQCGSCWAFSTTENFESMNFLATSKLPVLGPQQIVDCDPQSQGCGGGWTYWAFEYLLTAGGQELESDYPYTASDGTCAFDSKKVAAKLSNFTFATVPCESGDTCPPQDDLLRQQLVEQGPLSICVDAESWSDWTGPEPMQSADCPGGADELDHCVQLVGYDWTAKYWIARNSWNTDWGQAGYMFLETGGNCCGLGDVVTYANVKQTAHAPRIPRV